jgi:SOS-response transcriptional repressor LexA
MDIKDPETEAQELEKILKEVGNFLRSTVNQRGVSGKTFKEYKESFLKRNIKT